MSDFTIFSWLIDCRMNEIYTNNYIYTLINFFFIHWIVTFLERGNYYYCERKNKAIVLLNLINFSEEKWHNLNDIISCCNVGNSGDKVPFTDVKVVNESLQLN